MKKTLQVAAREFLATVATKGFLFGVLVTPAIVAAMIFFLPRLMNEETPSIAGEVAIVDPTGQVAPAVRALLAPEALAARREEEARAAAEKVKERVGGLAGGAAAQKSIEKSLGEVPRLDIVERPANANLDAEKEPLKAAAPAGGRLALVVVHPNAIARAAPGGEFGSYDLFVRGKLDDRIEGEIQSALREALVDARVRAAGLERSAIEALTTVPRVRSVAVTAVGERKTSEAFNMFLPMGFMMLMFVSVLSSGQYLMTTTIEEKSSRVVEVLLSAVSPLELMTGKILGQMAVGLVILILYTGLGLAALVSFAMVGLLDLRLLLYLLLFFLIAYTILASLMAAVGSAVNELREAQTLLLPVNMLMMIPWLLWVPITRDPNSTFSTVVSFIPPINAFAMLLRMVSSTPPPAWQVWLSIAIGALAAWGALWFATKVFRIGLLMYGKPPNFATLWRWARMA